MQPARPIVGADGYDRVVFGIVAVLTLHALIRIWGTSNIDVDEVGAVVQAQSFSLAYGARNPPLYDWLLFLAQRLLGPSIWTTQALKTALLIGSLWFLYAAIRPKFHRPPLAAAAVASFGLCIATGWEVFHVFTNNLALYFSLGFAFWSFMRVLDRGRPIDFAWFGLAIGLGLLSKVAFALVLAALMAVAAQRPYRSAFYCTKLALAGAIAAVVLAPYAIGLLAIGEQVIGAMASRTGAPVGQVALSLTKALLLTVSFWLPLALIVAAVLLREQVSLTGVMDRDPAFARLLFQIVSWSVGFTVVFFVVSRSTYGEQRLWTGPLYLLPVAIIAYLDARSDVTDSVARKLLNVFLAFIGAVMALRIVLFLFVSPPVCVPRCQAFIDYRPVAAAVAAAEKDGALVLANRPQTGGNLMQHLPRLRVIIPSLPPAGWANSDHPDYCLLVSLREYQGQPYASRAQDMAILLGRPPSPSELPQPQQITAVTAGWHTHLLPARWPPSVFEIMRLPSPHPICELGTSDQPSSG